MQKIRATFKKSKFTTAFLVLFGLHFLTIHGVVENLIYCFEKDGQINIESEAGSIFTIPSEKVVHAQNFAADYKPTFNAAGSSHHDVAFSLACSKEQQITRFDQKQTLKFLDGILYSKIENLPQSRVFQLVSYTPPLIEDTITTSLKTVVRILYN